MKSMKKSRRIKGEGTVFQVSDDKWCARIPASPETGGKTKEFSGKTKAAVAKKVKEFKEEIKNGYSPEKNTNMSEYMRKWLYDVKFMLLKPSSMDRLESTMNNHILPQIGVYKLSQVNADLIQDKVINHMQQASLSLSSIKKAHDALNDCFEYALSRQHLSYNPIAAVIMPREDSFVKKPIKYLTPDEIERFTQCCEQTYKNGFLKYQYGYVFLFMLYTGIRAGEMLKLCWRDCDEEYAYIRGNIVTVKDRSIHKSDDANKGIKLRYKVIEQTSAKTKSGTNRAVPLNSRAKYALEKVREINLDRFAYLPEHIVSGADETSISISTFTKSFSKIIEAANIEHCGIHTLRHTFASMLFEKNVDIKIISEILGHSNVGITYNTYVHLAKEQKKCAVDLINF